MTAPTFTEIGLRDPCPCGSGSIFAWCCLPKWERRAAETPSGDASALPALEVVPEVPVWTFNLAAVHAAVATRCVDPKCGRPITPGDIAFFDRQLQRSYCHNCGKCERYARKKAAERASRVADNNGIVPGSRRDEHK